jgi:hypothetical protein
VSGRIEPSRRRGHFDPRWPKRRPRIAAKRLVPARAGEVVPDGLDWDAFSMRYFPGRRRHDLKVISAYEAYKHGRRLRGSSRPVPRRRTVRLKEPVVPRAEAGRSRGPAAGGPARGGRASLKSRAKATSR